MTFLILGVLGGIISEKRYIAELTFVIEDPQSTASVLGSMSGIASQFGFEMGDGSSNTFSQSNILALLKSRRVVESAFMQKTKLADRQGLLIEHYLRINYTEENLFSIPFNDKQTFVRDSIISNIWRDIIEDKLVVEMKSDEANIISLSFSSLNDKFAKQFTEVLIDEMSKMYIVHKTAQAKLTLDFLEEREDSVENELELAEEEFAKIKDINQRIIKASGRLKELQLMRKVSVLNAMYMEIVKSLELSKITLLNNTPIINIIDKPILPLQKDDASHVTLGLLGAFIGSFFSVSFFIFRKLFRDSLLV